VYLTLLRIQRQPYFDRVHPIPTPVPPSARRHYAHPGAFMMNRRIPSMSSRPAGGATWRAPR
jgi:hypothetical protein